MKKVLRLIVGAGFLCLLLSFQSCFIFDSDSDSIDGDYEVLWIDTPKSRAVVERQSATASFVLIPEYVFAVGHNSDFIIAKQHPTEVVDNRRVIDTTQTKYYILDRNDLITENGDKVLGPYTKTQFEKKRRFFGIKDIEFDQVYPESPSL